MNPPGMDFQNYWILLSRFTGSQQWDRALATANEWLSSDPKNTHAHLVAAQSLINLKRHAEAEPHLVEVLAAQPDNDSAHRFMSIVHFHQGRIRAAEESIQRALSLDPTDPYHWFHLALMRHKEGDAEAAAKYAEKARELSPRDSDIINLLALCSPKNEEGRQLQFQQYQEALQLNPENAQVHNNLGAYYLNAEENFAKAEECFRRALFFDPTLKMARSNLFLTIKHRDIVYRVLCAPKDLILRGFGLARRNRALYWLTLPVWLVAFRFLLVGLVLWLLFVWPTVKIYEYLTIGDILAKVGELGARRGGLFGYRKWPLRIRLLIFALLLSSFWGTSTWLIMEKKELLSVLVGLAVVTALVTFWALWIRRKWKPGFFKWSACRVSRQTDKLLQPNFSQDN